MSRYISKNAREELLKRSQGLCECCGAGPAIDNHHMLEYHLGGPNTVENLIVLCPSCHRQIPKVLNRDQQKMLQKWHHQNNVGSNISAIAQLQSTIPIIDVGTVLFMDIKNIMRIDGQNIISLLFEKDKYYVNIVMLDDNFQHKLLVLGNKVIVNASYDLSIKKDRVVVSYEGEEILNISHRAYFEIRGKIQYGNELMKFDEDGYQVRGMYLANTRVEGRLSDFAAINIDSTGGVSLSV